MLKKFEDPSCNKWFAEQQKPFPFSDFYRKKKQKHKPTIPFQ